MRSAIAQAFRSEEVATAMAAAFLQRGPPPRPRGRPSTASATSECKSASSVISPFKDDEEACRRALRHVMDTVTVRLGLFWNLHDLFLSFHSRFRSFYSFGVCILFDVLQRLLSHFDIAMNVCAHNHHARFCSTFRAPNIWMPSSTRRQAQRRRKASSSRSCERKFGTASRCLPPR